MHFLFSWFFLYLALQCVCWVVLLHKEAHGHGEEGEDRHGDQEQGEEEAEQARVESPPSCDKALVRVDDDEEAKEEVLVDDLGGDMDNVLELDEAGAVPPLQLLPLCQVSPLPLIHQILKVNFSKYRVFLPKSPKPNHAGMNFLEKLTTKL